MTRIRLYAHPTLGAEQVFVAPSIGEWLLAHYGDAPMGLVQVFKGEPSGETEITGNLKALVASDAPEYVVLESPGDPGTLTVIGYVLTAVSVLTALTASLPSMPNNVNRTQQSQNNALGSRENQVRLMQRVEDIFGTVKAIPSLMMPTYNKYIRNDKYEYGYYCISRGYIDATEISDGDSLIANITGTSAAVYHPFTSPNSGDPVVQIGDQIIDPVLTVARSNEVDGITLKPLNQLQLDPAGTYKFSPDPAGDKITQTRKAPNVNAIINPGDQISVSMVTQAVTFVTTAKGKPALGGFSGSFLGTNPGGGGGGDSGGGSGGGG